MAKAHAQYQAMINEICAPAMPTTLKITSGVNGFKGMDPFNWTKDRDIYQRWQMWSEKARHALKTMDGDSEDNKISYFHHWMKSTGMESWKNNKVLISEEDYDKLEENRKPGKYSSEKIESYFILFESLLVPESNPLLAVEELKFIKQGSMTAGEFHRHVVKIVTRCQFPCAKAEVKGIRDAIFLGMNSTHARDKAINLMNEEGKELTVDFLLQQLEVEDCNAHHKSLSQLRSNNSVNMVAYDHRQNRSKSNKSKQASGKNRDQNKATKQQGLQILHIRVENPQEWRTSA